MSDEPAPRVIEADERLIARMERWRGLTLEIESLPPLPEVARLRVHVEPADWGRRELEVTERELPFELFEDLRAVAPQALLRDLHRPVRESPLVTLEVQGEPIDAGGRQALAEARAAQKVPRPPYVEPSTRAVTGELHRRRAMLRAPWQPVK